jgi:hypothetical protein
MFNRSKLATLALLLSAGLGGCRGPTELFSFIDRHCFVADWTNDHSCLSCRYCRNADSRPTVSKVHEPIPLPLEKPKTDANTAEANTAETEVTASDQPTGEPGRL